MKKLRFYPHRLCLLLMKEFERLAKLETNIKVMKAEINLSKKTAYVVGVHPHCFRRGEPAEVINVCNISPGGGFGSRMCYEVKYLDGFVDYVAISDIAENYNMGTFDDMEWSARFTIKDMFDFAAYHKTTHVDRDAKFDFPIWMDLKNMPYAPQQKEKEDRV